MAQQPGPQGSLIHSIQSEVHTEASPLLHLLVNNAKWIFLAFGVFILVIVGHYFYSSHTEKQLKAEQQAFGVILTSTSGKPRIEAIEKYLKTAPEHTRLNALLALAKDAQEEKDHDLAYNTWEQIGKIKQDLTVEAALGMEQALIAQGKYKEALDLLEATLPNTPKAFNVLFNTEIASLAEILKDYDRAALAYESVAGTVTDPQESRFWKQKRASLEMLKAKKS